MRNCGCDGRGEWIRTTGLLVPNQVSGVLQWFAPPYGLITFQGVRGSLFAYNTRTAAEGGYADFDSIDVAEEAARPIPHGKRIELSLHDGSGRLRFGDNDTFTVTDRKLGRIALRTKDGFVSVNENLEVALRNGSPELPRPSSGWRHSTVTSS